MARLRDAIQRGTRATQPLATAVSDGCLYSVTDEGRIIEQSNGSAWQSYSPSNPLTSGSVVKLSQIVTAASQATVDFTSISGSYSSLKVLWFAQDTQAGTSVVDIRLKINNDGTSGNYTAVSRIGSENGTAFANTNAASAAGVQVGNLPQSGNTSVTAEGEVTLIGYADTTFHKRIRATATLDSGTLNGTVFGVEGARWKSTSAINRLTFTAGGTAFTDGSTFTLYGLL